MPTDRKDMTVKSKKKKTEKKGRSFMERLLGTGMASDAAKSLKGRRAKMQEALRKAGG